MNSTESSPLINIQIASPCHADWVAMKGDAVVRNCQSCQKNVYNISEMNRAAAEKLIRENEGNVCVRFYRRADGTIITDDCPVGVKVVKRSVRWISSAVATAAAFVLGLLPGIAHAYPVRKPHVHHTAVPAKAAAPHRKAIASRPTRLMGRVGPRHNNSMTMGTPALPPPLPVHVFKPRAGLGHHPARPKGASITMGEPVLVPADTRFDLVQPSGLGVPPMAAPLPRVTHPEVAPSPEPKPVPVMGLIVCTPPAASALPQVVHPDSAQK